MASSIAAVISDFSIACSSLTGYHTMSSNISGAGLPAGGVTSSIGAVSISVVADTSGLQTGLAAAEARTQEFGTTAASNVKEGTDKVSASMKEMGHEVHAASRVFERFVGIPALVAGVA